MTDFLVKNWKWILLAVVAGIALLWVNSRLGISKTLWNMARQDIDSDRAEVESDLVGEINRLADERDGIAKKLALLQADKAQLEKDKKDLQGALDKLQAKLDNLVVPSEPGPIVDGLRQYGLGSARRNLR